MTLVLQRLAKTMALAGLAVTLAISGADARAGGGGSSGSRGSATFSRPPATATAPKSAQPMQRTETPAVNGQQPGFAPTAAPARRGFGFGGGLMAGLLGAGLLGALFGGGFFGGLGSIASFLGLLIQVGLVVGLVWLALRFFRRRQEPALAGAGAPYARTGLGFGGGLPGGGPQGGSGQPRPPAWQPIEIGSEDFQAFERSLGEIQLAYGRGDLGTLTRLATPEMVRYFEQDLAADRAKGVRNEVTQPKLLQGDLAEAWREGGAEYATVAMRFEIIDVMVETATGRVVAGHASVPTEATELWTFRRDNGGPWTLSAIQQTA